ncbi:copper amine oxidase N-terminal domain-containing protein [Schinkia azotoformans]|uniref:copper amine oxidase N-terminal domain-containing protein n=1 Tax=Schinkia azotoformans TaxID=1454 RepID=UPI002DBC5C7F|nr:copper amine oxidase N-terminal domain-containing protein [Schinkia azotoformans]MEC1717788.1 copper amine oxidase N-terminal domain-containing protein [Schinkia azotoformans]MEC1743580.1 copper amine oxidase N-terminal domain-containing protein [Schinkia azotoformans]MEC1746546.1 copper amine oxidase N-terminal domain-containing protein [Schinkia azotoformans]MEC1760224.1 copper amine oxidase N-terminal domain-containing protein [Schinkia azotoformans]MEC1769295.1 copper amine oxidase N-te
MNTNNSKRIKRLLISTTLVGSLVLSGNVAFASDLSENAEAASEAQVEIDGNLVSFSQPAVVKNGSTLVPLRGIFEALGAKVDWNQATQTVTGTKGDLTVKLTIGQKTAYVNGKAVQLAEPAQILNGSTMVPLRFIGESLGSKVSWNGTTQTAIIQDSSAVTQPSTPVAQQPTKPVEQPKETNDGKVVNGIKANYGSHTYAVKNQKEYDQVMSIIDNALDQADREVFGGRYEDSFREYMDAYPNWNKSDKLQVSVDKRIGALMKAGVNKNEIEWVYKLSAKAAQLSQQADAGRDGTPRSAYDDLVNKVGDCDSSAQAHSALFDAAGFSTAIVAGKNHATMFFKINGKWFSQNAGTFGGGVETLTTGNGYWFLSNPTF